MQTTKSSSADTHLLHYGPGSIAEQIVFAHKGNSNQVSHPDKPLVQREDKLFYPRNPENNYISRYPTSFRECLGCGDTNHLFRLCPPREDKSVHSAFWQEIWAHIPSVRKKGREQWEERTSIPASTYYTSASVATNDDGFTSDLGQGKKTISWITN